MLAYLSQAVASGGGLPEGGTVGDIIVNTALGEGEWTTPDEVTAADVPFTPAGSIAATNVQAAIAEAASESATALSDHTGDATAAHAATAISFTPAGTIAATTVQAAIEEAAAEAVASGIPGTLLDAKGDLIVASAADTAARLAKGTDGQVLESRASEATGLKWVDAPGGGILATTIDAKGDLLVGSANDAVDNLPVGTNGHVLTADSAETLGVKWAAAAGGGAPSQFQFRSGRYYVAPQGQAAAAANVDPVNGRMYAVPFWVGASTAFDRLGIDLFTVANSPGVFRLGIYSDTGMYPDALRLDTGTVAATASPVEATIAETLAAGLWWLVCVEQGAPSVSAVVRMISGGSGIYASPIGKASIANVNPQLSYMTTGTTGALPGTFPAAISSSTNAPLIHIRAA